ncbi:DNA-binding response regulator [Streptomyces sioyaensis]|uniref:DNA-binding response regulator n=1 Tax=Streptomyces sioyaensis TaxID=67364 RepID=UPI003F53F91E
MTRTAPRILVVEDDHGRRDVLARGLRDEECDVVTAADGAAGCAPSTRPWTRWCSTSDCRIPTGGTSARRCGER